MTLPDFCGAAMRWLFDRNVLENEFRAVIFRYIQENPETYAQKTIKETNLSRGTVLYHLDILHYAGMMTCMKDSKFKKYRTALKVII
jgi:predicted transcriptional regulator